ncbi:MAG: hypothetical protein AAF762_11815 [Pseudomonadota bacterium]
MCALVLSGCGDSGLNPFGWFGGQQEEPTETVSDAQIVTIEDPRPLIASVTAVRVERTPGGAIVRATGLPPEQGWHSAGLVRRGSVSNGVLTFDFRAIPPETPTRTSTVQSRELVVAFTLSNTTLQSVRQIRVVGATNALTTRR